MPPTKKPAPPGTVKSAQRVLDLFELFEAEQHPMRVSEIANKLDAPLSSVSMLLKTLRARGYVEFNRQSRSYQPSARLSFLGDWSAGSVGTRAAIQKAMRHLADEIRDTVLLGWQNDLLMQYLAIIDSPRDMRLAPTTGTRRPMHASALGIVLLSVQSDDVIGRYVRRYNREHGSNMGLASEPALRREVDKVRQAGHYRSLGTTTPHAGVIAQIVPSSVAGEPMAIGLGGPLEHVRDVADDWAQALNTAVRLL